MIFPSAVILLLSVALVLVFLYSGTFFFLFMERFISARVQHRDGPGRQGRMNPFQVWRDYRKTRIKLDAGPSLAFRFRLALLAWRILPAAFLLVLLGGVIPENLAGAELPLLLLLPFLATSLEAIFLHASTDPGERVEWRKFMILRVMGATLLVFSFLSVTLQKGAPGLDALSMAQSSFPFMAILSSPGLFICGIASLGAIFLFVNESPIQNEGEMSLGNRMHYTVFFHRRMWIFCLLSFWVFVFLGGVYTLPQKVLFPLKLVLVLFGFILLQGSFPRIRSADAGELAIRWLFRLCILGFLVEALWVGVA